MKHLKTPLNLFSENRHLENNFEYCSITYPDGAIVNFKILTDNIYSKNINIKLHNYLFNKRRDNLSGFEYMNFYLSVYGNNIRFEDLEKYQFSRNNLNKEELEKINFSTLLFNNKKESMTSCQFRFISDYKEYYNMERGRAPMDNSGIIGEYRYETRRNITRFVTENTDWREKIGYFFENYRFYIYNYLSEIYNLDENYIIPDKLKIFENLTLVSALYLFGVINGFSEIKKLDYLFKITASSIKTSSYLDSILDLENMF